MKTKAITIMFSLLMLVVQFCIAQQKEAHAKPVSVQKPTGTSAGRGSSETGLRPVEVTLEGVEGNVYLGEDWPTGILTLKDGKTINDFRFRYDIYSDQMQYISGKDTLAFAAPSELKSVVFNDRTFTYEPYECNSILMKGYFQILTPGKTQLLLKRSVSYHLPEEEKAPVEANETFLITECYFIKKGNLPAHKVLCSRKDVLIELNDKKAEMEDYLKKTGNKVRTVEDLKKMVAYYNSLE
jgi:hypothetical protein